MIFSKKGELAIEPVYASKVEIDPGAGFSRATSRSKVLYANLVFSYEYNGRIYEAGKAQVIIPGEAAHQAWAKKEYELERTGKSFILCPEVMVLGFQE